MVFGAQGRPAADPQIARARAQGPDRGRGRPRNAEPGGDGLPRPTQVGPPTRLVLGDGGPVDLRQSPRSRPRTWPAAPRRTRGRWLAAPDSSRASDQARAGRWRTGRPVPEPNVQTADVAVRATRPAPNPVVPEGRVHAVSRRATGEANHRKRVFGSAGFGRGGARSPEAGPSRAGLRGGQAEACAPEAPLRHVAGARHKGEGDLPVAPTGPVEAAASGQARLRPSWSRTRTGRCPRRPRRRRSRHPSARSEGRARRRRAVRSRSPSRRPRRGPTRSPSCSAGSSPSK